MEASQNNGSEFKALDARIRKLNSIGTRNHDTPLHPPVKPYSYAYQASKLKKNLNTPTQNAQTLDPNLAPKPCLRTLSFKPRPEGRK